MALTKVGYLFVMITFICWTNASNHYQRCNKECGLVNEIICASNGKTFLNRCYFDNYNCKTGKTLDILHYGGCLFAGKNTRKGGRAKKNKKGKKCGIHMKLICASDGKTYFNRCYFEKHNRSKMKNGLHFVKDGACVTPNTLPVTRPETRSSTQQFWPKQTSTPLPFSVQKISRRKILTAIKNVKEIHIWVGVSIVGILFVCSLVIVIILRKKLTRHKDDSVKIGQRWVKMDFNRAHTSPISIGSPRYEQVQPIYNMVGDSDPQGNVYDELFSPRCTEQMSEFPKQPDSTPPIYSTIDNIHQDTPIYEGSFGLEGSSRNEGDVSAAEFSNDIYFDINSMGNN